MTRANLSILINVVAGLTRSMPGHRVVLALTVGLILLGCGGLVPTAVPKLEGEICVEAGTASFCEGDLVCYAADKTCRKVDYVKQKCDLKSVGFRRSLVATNGELVDCVDEKAECKTTDDCVKKFGPAAANSGVTCDVSQRRCKYACSKFKDPACDHLGADAFCSTYDRTCNYKGRFKLERAQPVDSKSDWTILEHLYFTD